MLLDAKNMLGLPLARSPPPVPSPSALAPSFFVARVASQAAGGLPPFAFQVLLGVSSDLRGDN
jgi:hypothetical protein